MHLRLCALLAALLIAVPVAAPEARDPIADAVFTAIERQIIGDYYRDHQITWFDREDWDGDGPPEWAKPKKGKKDKKDKKGLPPGLAKKDRLPPGLAKQLARNGTLPPGLAGRALPSDLRVRLPLRADGQEIIFLDDQALLIDRSTNLILDLLRLGGR